MIGLLINLLIILLILGVAWWVFTIIAGALGLPPIIVTVAQVVLVVICLILLINLLLGLGGTGSGLGWHLGRLSTLALTSMA
jgi:hypothetical protein